MTPAGHGVETCAVGVVPDQVGRRTGTALLEHRLAEVDAEHTAAYLENSLERNLPLYERLGSVVTEEIRLGPGAPPEWLLRRAPGSGAEGYGSP